MGLMRATPDFGYLKRPPLLLLRRGIARLQAMGRRRWGGRSAQFPPPPGMRGDPQCPESVAPEILAPPPSPAPLVDSDALTGVLRQCGEALTAVCAQTEADFLDLGDRLHAIQAEAQKLTRTIVAALGEDQSASIHGALRAIERNATAAIQEVREQRRQLAEDLRGLQAIQADLGLLHRKMQQFRQVAKNLKMVGLTISIESARSQKATAAFQSLAEEITLLARTVHAAVGHISDDTLAAQQTLDAVQADIGPRMTQLEMIMSDAETAVQSAMRQVGHFMQMRMTALDRIGAQSRRIEDQVGQLVVGIQIHDNISQRAAHIQDALAEASHVIQTAARDQGNAAVTPEVLGRVYGINRLQLAQLQTIAEDVDGAHRQSETALGALLSAVTDVIRTEALDTVDVDAFCRIGVACNSHPVALLTGELERLIHLLDEGLNHIRRMAGAREQTGRIMARMSAHIEQVRDINFDIRLKALNAVIRSQRLGRSGRAIAAIVNEMKALAEQSNTTIGAVAEIMGRIADASREMDAAHGDKGLAVGAGERLRRGIEDFTAACSVFKEHSHQALEIGRRLEDRIGQSRSAMGFFETMVQVCRAHLDQMAQIKLQLQPCADAAPDDWMAEEQRIMARYTMDREREAHLGTAGPDRVTDGVSSDADDALDDNVELF